MYLAISLRLSRGLCKGDLEGPLRFGLLGALLQLYLAAWETLLQVGSVQEGVLQTKGSCHYSAVSLQWHCSECGKDCTVFNSKLTKREIT